MKTLKTAFKIIKIWVISGILFFSMPVAVNAEGNTDTVAFIHITDSHICNLANYHPSFAEKRRHYGEGIKSLMNFFRTVPKMSQSDFVVITGDLIDYYEAETVTGDMLGTQIEQFVKCLDVSTVPVYMTLGNHDIASYPFERRSSAR